MKTGRQLLTTVTFKHEGQTWHVSAGNESGEALVWITREKDLVATLTLPQLLERLLAGETNMGDA